MKTSKKFQKKQIKLVDKIVKVGIIERVEKAQVRSEERRVGKECRL